MGLCFLSIEELTSYEEAAKNENWRNAMKSEILSIEKNRMWELTDLKIIKQLASNGFSN